MEPAAPMWSSTQAEAVWFGFNAMSRIITDEVFLLHMQQSIADLADVSEIHPALGDCKDAH